MKTFKILTGLFIALLSFNVVAQTLDLGWISPGLRSDNTELLLSEIATYRISYGTAPGVYTNTVDVPAPATGTSIEFLPGGTYYVTVTVIDTGGRPSVLAPEESITLEIAPPKSVTGLTLTAGALTTP